MDMPPSFFDSASRTSNAKSCWSKASRTPKPVAASTHSMRGVSLDARRPMPLMTAARLSLSSLKTRIRTVSSLMETLLACVA